MKRKLGLHWIIQKFLRCYERLQQEKEKRIRRISTGDSDSESEGAPHEIRPLPSNQCHVVYSRHSRTHLNTETILKYIKYHSNELSFQMVGFVKTYFYREKGQGKI